MSLAAVLLQTSTALAVNPNTGTTTTGQTLSISIDSPADGSDVLVPPGEVTVTGQTAIGALAASANVFYMLDVSGSTGISVGDCDGDGSTTVADNLNGDGGTGDVLDCEISGVLALNDSLTGANVDVGVGAFSNGSPAVGDVDPAAGDQPFTTPSDVDGNANSTPDVEEVVRSVRRSSIGQFTTKGAGFGGTDFNQAVIGINNAFATQSTGEDNIAFLLSDGNGSLSQGPGTPLQQAIDAGTTVNTFSVGTSAAGCGASSNLRKIADATGGACTEVSDPSQLSAALSGVTPAGIDRVEVALNGGTPIVATLNAVGDFGADLTGLVVGANTVVATVFADDGTTVSADITLNGLSPNQPPECSGVVPSMTSLWPPNHKLRTVSLTGATDPDGDAVTLQVSGVTQDEPVNGTGDGDTAPDAVLQSAGDEVQLRAERSGPGDGRVYRVSFTVTDPAGASCSGTVTVGVPHDQRGAPATDSGDTFDSTTP